VKEESRTSGYPNQLTPKKSGWSAGKAKNDPSAGWHSGIGNARKQIIALKKRLRVEGIRRVSNNTYGTN
jgi:hypothetical protein